MDTGAEFLRVRSLSDEALLLGLSHSLRASRRAVAEVVAHLGEVEERRLHLLGGHSSLFAYCVSRLRMSEDEAWRRIEVARLCRVFPQLFQLLAGGRGSLSVATLLRGRLTDANHQPLLAAVSGKTVAEAREVLAAWFPQPDVLPLLLELPVRAAPAATAQDVAAAAEPEIANVSAADAAERTPRVPPQETPGHGGPAPSAASIPRSIDPLSPGRYKLQLTVSAELKRKLDLARDLLRHAVPSGDLATLVERALDVLLEQTERRRFAHRSATPGSSKAARESTRPTDEATAEPSATTSATSMPSARHIPNQVRREVYARDDGRCTWRSSDGVRCDSRAWLEHDHIIPRGLGGTNEATNIRGFCRAHNRLAAEQVYGKETIARIIARKRARRERARASGASPDVTPPHRRLALTPDAHGSAWSVAGEWQTRGLNPQDRPPCGATGSGVKAEMTCGSVEAPERRALPRRSWGIHWSGPLLVVASPRRASLRATCRVLCERTRAVVLGARMTPSRRSRTPSRRSRTPRARAGPSVCRRTNDRQSPCCTEPMPRGALRAGSPAIGCHNWNMNEAPLRWFALSALLCWACAEGDTKVTDAGSCTEPGDRPRPGPVGSSQGVQTIEVIRAIPIKAPEVATSCSRSGLRDDCGCGELTCAAGQTCVYGSVPTTGIPAEANRCYSVCASDMDCAADELCIAAYGHTPQAGNTINPVPVCKKAGCRSSDECCSGRCVVWTYYESQGTSSAFWGITCE